MCHKTYAVMSIFLISIAGCNASSQVDNEASLVQQRDCTTPGNPCGVTKDTIATAFDDNVLTAIGCSGADLGTAWGCVERAHAICTNCDCKIQGKTLSCSKHSDAAAPSASTQSKPTVRIEPLWGIKSPTWTSSDNVTFALHGDPDCGTPEGCMGCSVGWADDNHNSCHIQCGSCSNPPSGSVSNAATNSANCSLGQNTYYDQPNNQVKCP